MNINGCKKWLEYVGVILFTIHCSLFLVSCSKDTEEEDEHANWKQRNDAVIDQWSANSALTTYKRIGLSAVYRYGARDVSWAPDPFEDLSGRRGLR